MNQNGIGLGLVIIDKIVKKFDGEMGFESVAGKGSIFSFSFKLEDYQDKIEEVENNGKNFKFRWSPTTQEINDCNSMPG